MFRVIREKPVCGVFPEEPIRKERKIIAIPDIFIILSGISPLRSGSTKREILPIFGKNHLIFPISPRWFLPVADRQRLLYLPVPPLFPFPIPLSSSSRDSMRRAIARNPIVRSISNTKFSDRKKPVFGIFREELIRKERKTSAIPGMFAIHSVNLRYCFECTNRGMTPIIMKKPFGFLMERPRRYTKRK